MKKIGILCIICSFAFFANSKGMGTGYRGFVDVGYSIGIDNSAESHIDLMTTHGCQVLPQLFLGVGTGINYYGQNGMDNVAIPIYADARFDFNSNKFAPFADVKLGYTPNVNDIKGFYMSLGGGLRYGLNNSLALNFGLHYILQKINLGGARANGDCIGIKVGLEF